MSNILLLANLNCDRVLQLDKSLTTGGRHHYRDLGRRLGGGGANTGIGLILAGHHVALVSQIGTDDTADWLLAEASLHGIDCSLLQRNNLVTPELLLLMTPDKERTIVRPERPLFELQNQPDFSHWDALYINCSAVNVSDWANAALPNTLVVAQLAKDECLRPCHVLITSKSDLEQHQFTNKNDKSIWEYGQSIAGPELRHFIVTDSAQGAVVYEQNVSIHVPAIPSTVVDTTGAGDCFAAGIIDALLADKPIIEAVHQGTSWASIAVATASSIPGQAFKTYLSKNTNAF
jgi:sugar/nucleoside kinase (ribokinase family)